MTTLGFDFEKGEFIFKSQFDRNSKATRNKGNRLREFLSNYTLFDLETTGLSVNSSEIIEIAAVKVRNNDIVDSFSSLIKPEETIPPQIIALTGITNEMVTDAPSISDVLPKFIDFIGNDVLVGHNINSYDLNIIYDSAEAMLDMKLSNDFVDTLDLAHCLCELEVSNYKLETICEALCIKNNNAHRALSDVLANNECYQKMKNYTIGKYKNIPSQQENEDKNFVCSIDVTDKRICLTGEFKCASRNYVKERLNQLGAKVTNCISKKTDYLLIGDFGTTTTHKIDEANKFGTKIVYEKDFFKETEVNANV